MRDNEFKQRFSGRYFGKYRGIVKEVDTDENQLLRIKVMVPVVLGNEELIGFAWPATGIGGVGWGLVCPPQVNDLCWIEFEEGDPQKPIWSGGIWGIRDDTNMLPLHARGEEDDIDNTLRSVGNIGGSTFGGSYPNVRILQSPKKHLLEFDDTDGAERVQLGHQNGTRIEFLEDGSAEYVTKDELRTYSGANNSIESGADIEWKAAQSVTLEAGTTATFKSSGGEIVLTTSGAPGIQLGGASATEPFVMGTQWQTQMTNLITLISTHTHATVVGESAPPTQAGGFIALISQLVNAISAYIFGK